MFITSAPHIRYISLRLWLTGALNSPSLNSCTNNFGFIVYSSVSLIFYPYLCTYFGKNNSISRWRSINCSELHEKKTVIFQWSSTITRFMCRPTQGSRNLVCRLPQYIRFVQFLLDYVHTEILQNRHTNKRTCRANIEILYFDGLCIVV